MAALRRSSPRSTIKAGSRSSFQHCRSQQSILLPSCTHGRPTRYFAAGTIPRLIHTHEARPKGLESAIKYLAQSTYQELPGKRPAESVTGSRGEGWHRAGSPRYSQRDLSFQVSTPAGHSHMVLLIIIDWLDWYLTAQAHACYPGHCAQ